MSKLAKETHVFIPCPACGKTERVKLKWAEGHKTLKCRKCKERVDLRHNPAQGLIARTAAAVATFEKALDMLHAEAKKDAKVAKVHKAAAKKGKKKAGKKAGKKRAAKRVIRSPDLALPPSPVDPASL
jgi:transcription elongation factor Elf1